MDMYYDNQPISWNKPLMRVKARIDSGKGGLNNFNTFDKFVTIQKFTGNTIKKTFTSFNPNSGKVCYGSHSHKCWSCSAQVKQLQKDVTNFKRYTVGCEIKDNNSNDY
jgi:hypothetical protein